MLWDSGVVKDSRCFGILYQGKKLHSAQKAYWKVMVWDGENQASVWSETASFETGLLEREDWKGVSGPRWYYHPDDKKLPIEQRRPHPKFPDRAKDREDAVQFFMDVSKIGVNKLAIENPVGIMSSRWRKPDQIIEPWQFGHEASKKWRCQ